MFALFMLTGIASTLLLPETKGKSLEELSNEDQDEFVRGGCHIHHRESYSDTITQVQEIGALRPHLHLKRRKR